VPAQRPDYSSKHVAAREHYNWATRPSPLHDLPDFRRAAQVQRSDNLPRPITRHQSWWTLVGRGRRRRAERRLRRSCRRSPFAVYPRPNTVSAAWAMRFNLLWSWLTATWGLTSPLSVSLKACAMSKDMSE
jgi:hypothetical protein